MSTNEDRRYDRLGAIARADDRPLRELAEIMKEGTAADQAEPVPGDPAGKARNAQALREANARRHAEAVAVIVARTVLAMRILAEPYRCAGLSR
jgi:hypothetical protein